MTNRHRFAIGTNDLPPLLLLDHMAGRPAGIFTGEIGFYAWLERVEASTAPPVDPDAALVAFDAGSTPGDYALQLQAAG